MISYNELNENILGKLKSIDIMYFDTDNVGRTSIRKTLVNNDYTILLGEYCLTLDLDLEQVDIIQGDGLQTEIEVINTHSSFRVEFVSLYKDSEEMQVSREGIQAIKTYAHDLISFKN